MLFLTTTAIDIDEELMNRCLVLTVDESREQTRAIHALQRRRQTLEGLLAGEDRAVTLALHRNAQTLLEGVKVVNPFADRLTFLDDKTRTRRDHMRSEEHTSELQSLMRISYAVFCLKKKNKIP